MLIQEELVMQELIKELEDEFQIQLNTLVNFRFIIFINLGSKSDFIAVNSKEKLLQNYSSNAKRFRL